MNLIPFQGLFPKTDLIADTDSFYGTAKYNYRQYLDSGFFERDPSEAFYVYQIKSEKYSHTGIVATVDIQDLIDNNVLPHEKTLSAKEQEQLQLTLERKAIIKPVLLAFKSFKAFRNFVKTKTESPADIEQKLNKNKEVHKFWKVSDGADVQLIMKMFKNKVSKSYIADGHHRCSVSQIIYNQAAKKAIPLGIKSLLSVLMPFEEMDIYDYNRVVEVGNTLKPFELMARLSDLFKITQLESQQKPKEKHSISMMIEDRWFMLHWRKSVLNEFKNEKIILDYQLLNEMVLKRILKIKDVREHPGITYVPGPDKFKGIKKAMKNLENGVAFMLFPLKPNELCYYADKGKTLPPKSTYFHPRVINGMIVQELNK